MSHLPGSTKDKRTFDQFYIEQLQFAKNKMDNIQNNIVKRDKIFEEMKKRRERISHLSDNSKRILSQSRERNQSNERLNIANSSKSDVKDISISQKTTKNEFSLKSVHDRLFHERSVIDKNRSMVQFKENMKIK